MSTDDGQDPRSEPPWIRRNPVPAALAVGVGAYLLFGLSLVVIGDVAPEDAFGMSSVIGALVVAFISWAVFSRPETDRKSRDG